MNDDDSLAFPKLVCLRHYLNDITQTELSRDVISNCPGLVMFMLKHTVTELDVIIKDLTTDDVKE